MFEEIDWKRFRGEQLVGVATGGKSREREISLKTGRAFEEALKAKGYNVVVYDVARDLGAVVEQRPSVMVLGIHGGLGERGALQGFLESLEIPYTGSGVLASALAMDKDRSRLICAAHGVPVAAGVLLERAALSEPRGSVAEVLSRLKFPVVAKLNDSGSSFGVHICTTREELVDALKQLYPQVSAAASSSVLVEQFIEGAEYSVGFFGGRPLGVMEIRPGGEFYDFEAKYQSTDTVYEVVRDPDICEPLINWSKQALDALGCRGVSRVDFKGRPGEWSRSCMLEVNTIPGMTATSLVPKLAAEYGISFEDFVEAMLVTATWDED